MRRKITYQVFCFSHKHGGKVWNSPQPQCWMGTRPALVFICHPLGYRIKESKNTYCTRSRISPPTARKDRYVLTQLNWFQQTPQDKITKPILWKCHMMAPQAHWAKTTAGFIKKETSHLWPEVSILQEFNRIPSQKGTFWELYLAFPKGSPKVTNVPKL